MTNRSDLDQIVRLEQEARTIAQGLDNLDAGCVITSVAIGASPYSPTPSLTLPGTMAPAPPMPSTPSMTVSVPGPITDKKLLKDLHTALTERQDEITQQLADLGVT
jgi:hypothetical protein